MSSQSENHKEGTIRVSRKLLVGISFTIIFSYISSLVASKGNIVQISAFYDDNYAINTPGCIIPAMQPFSRMVKKYEKYIKRKTCQDMTYSLLKQNRSHIMLNKNKRVMNHYQISEADIRNIKCCYFSFYRPKHVAPNMEPKLVDNRITYNECIYFHNVKNVKDEFVRVKCNLNGRKLIDKFFVFVHLNKRVGNNLGKLKNHRRLSEDYNVLIVGIDNVSRLNFYRRMPKTLAYLKQRGAVELMGYTKVGENSYPNIMPLLLGLTTSETRKVCHLKCTSYYDGCPFIWKRYKKAGYYTALGEDHASLGTFNWGECGFRDTPTDYYLHPFISEAEVNAGNAKDLRIDWCINEYYAYQLLLDYIEDLTKYLKEFKLFGFFWEASITHSRIQSAKYMDFSYARFFRQLAMSKYLENTIIFLISDHGMRWGSFSVKTQQGYLEERLPPAYILIPPSFRKKYSKAFDNLVSNSRRLTTPFDIHETLFDLADLKRVRDDTISNRSNMHSQKRGISLFLKISENRTCQSAGIISKWCCCYRRKEISKKSRATLLATKYLIKYLNNLVRSHPKCARLSLYQIILSNGIEEKFKMHLKNGWRDFLVVVKVKPGGGVFRATLRNEGDDWSVVGTVSRLNQYGNQSYCVPDARIKPYCYCA